VSTASVSVSSPKASSSVYPLDLVHQNQRAGFNARSPGTHGDQELAEPEFVTLRINGLRRKISATNVDRGVFTSTVQVPRSTAIDKVGDFLRKQIPGKVIIGSGKLSL
jgi:hypothetical protein